MNTSKRKVKSRAKKPAKALEATTLKAWQGTKKATGQPLTEEMMNKAIEAALKSRGASQNVTVAPTVVIGQGYQIGQRGRGQPTAYKPEYCEQLLDFFDVAYTREVEVTRFNKEGDSWTEYKTVVNSAPQILEFARKIGVCRDTIYEWAKVHKDFSDALTRAKEMSEAMTVANAMLGYYNPVFTQLVMKNRFGWKDKSELEANSQVTIKIDSSDAGL